MNPRAPTLALLLAALALAPGCLGEKSESALRAQIPADQIRLADDLRLPEGDWPAAAWWRRYDDVQLDALVEKALAESPAVAAARAVIEQARAQGDMLRGSLLPQINAIGFINREKVSESGMLGPYAKNYPQLGLTGPWYTAGTVGLIGSLGIDLWGQKRAAIAAVVGKRNAYAAEAALVERALAEETANLYFALQANHQMLGLLKETREVLEFVLEARRERAANGMDAEAAIQGARAQLIGVNRQIAAAQGQLTQGREALRALIGAGPDYVLEIDPVPLPAASVAVPPSLSYDLLARRPDLQALRWYVQASLHQIDAARAAFYPRLDIAAFFGQDTIHLSNLFDGGSRQMNLIPSLYLPIFNGGALRGNLRGARAAGDLAVEEYNQAVLNAVRDVAMGGNLLRTLLEERALQAEKVAAVAVACDAAEAAHRRGLATRTALMEARLPVIAERASLLLLDGQCMGQEIALVKALGGGYRAEAPAP